MYSLVGGQWGEVQRSGGVVMSVNSREKKGV